MIDLDLIANLDKATGLPEVDHLSPTQRWRDALNHGCGRNTSSDIFTPRKHFGPVGADHNTKPKTAAPTAANTNNLMKSNTTTQQSKAPASWNQHAPPIVTLEAIIDEVGVIRDFAHEVANAPEWFDDIWLSSDPDTQSYQLETFIRTCPSTSKAVLANFCELLGGANAAVILCGNLGCIKASINIPANTGNEKIAEIAHEFLSTVQFVSKIATEAGIVPANRLLILNP
jgi:hypothetical protein